MLSSMTMLAIAAPVVLYVEERRAVEEDSAEAIIEILERGVRTQLQSAVVVEQGSPCMDPLRCVEDIRSRTGAEHVITLRLLGAVTRTRVLLESFERGHAAGRAEELTLDATRETWPDLLDGALRRLFPPPPLLLTTEPEGSGPSRVGPLVLLGSSLLSFAVGVGFGASSATARDDLSESGGSDMPRLADQVDDHALVAHWLIGGAITGVVGGLLWLAFDR